MGDVVGVGCEAVQQRGRGVEPDDRDLVRHVADEGVEHGAEAAVVVEMRGGVAAGFDADDERERLVSGVLFETERLGDAVVGEQEVVGLEGEDEIAGLGADQRGHQHQRGVDRDAGLRRRGVVGGLRMRGGNGGEQKRDGGGAFHP